jgi:hypothetical protein
VTYEQAVALYASAFWEPMSYHDRAMFQLHEPRLCMPVEVLYEALARSLGRPVYTHELALNREGLARELRGEAPAPTPDEILTLIPVGKRIVILTGGAQP